jgi:hypothetical protein
MDIIRENNEYKLKIKFFIKFIQNFSIIFK